MILSTTIDLFRNTRALLIGDIMLDKYVFGVIERISPEAPVPVFLSKEKKQVLGGAGNVFNNLTSMEVQTTFLTVIGKDHSGKEIKKLLSKKKFSKSFLFEEKERDTTVKTRYLSNNQQIIRIDEEKAEQIQLKTSNLLIKKFNQLVIKNDIVIISDYNKGLFQKKNLQKIISTCNKLKVPVIIDPKRNDFNIYRGATLVTPNKSEASIVSNLSCDTDDQVERCGRHIAEKYKIKNVIITRAEKGLSWISKTERFHVTTKIKEVYDVSGAGDTVLAIIASCLPNNINYKFMLELANKAAAIVIGKLGTTAISVNDLKIKNITSIKKKIVTLNQLKKKVSALKDKGFKIGFTNGCFDLLHAGHLSYLAESKELCDILIIAINNDYSVKKLKGKDRPLNNEKDRAKILASLNFCDFVIIFSEDTPLKLIKALKPHIITKGGDYRNKKIVGEKEVISWGGNVNILNFKKGYSTTKIIGKL